MANQLPQTARTPPAQVKPSKQYDLFTSFFGDAKNLSNTIELWDAIPKYSISARQQNKLRDSKGNLPVFEHTFEYRPTIEGAPTEISCELTIQPASVKNPDGSYTQYYPSTDEELIEEVLKKIFTDQQFGMHTPSTGESWVRFTLYMIQSELKQRGKTRSLDEIKTSLEILSRAVYEVKFTGAPRKMIYTGQILNDMVRTTRQDYLHDPKTLWCARLPALVSKSVNELSYRQFNYGTLMSLSMQLARWFHKRLSHQYINAHVIHPYNILYTSIKRDSGLLSHTRTSSNIETVDNSLAELKKANVLMDIKKDDRRQGQKITDVLYILTPTMDFTDEIKTANARQRDHQALLAKERQAAR
jgi:hypothetical protein